MKQYTIRHEASLTGKALHTGEPVTLTLKPALEDQGIVFCRTDLPSRPMIRPSVEKVTDLLRNTTVASGHNCVHTVEHILSALHGCGIDNAIVELDAEEPPVMDGSAKDFVALIQKAQPVAQHKGRGYFALKETVAVTSQEHSIVALPHDGLRVTCTSQDRQGLHTQHFSIDIDPETYAEQIAPARTFTVYEDIEGLLEKGKLQGGSLDSAIVLKDDKILTKEPLRFENELVRHKILDLIGDVLLLGLPLKAHLIAICPGHALNAKFTQLLREKYLASQKLKPERNATDSTINSAAHDTESTAEVGLDIQNIMQILPHRYPFLLIDRVTSITPGESLVAIKNVSINEPYFSGHFPSRPVMPGVLQIESMAQASGVLILSMVKGKYLAYLASCDNVKFRRPVQPGDQIEIRVKLLKNRSNRFFRATGECYVEGQLASSVEFSFARDKDIAG